jgi:hypothetical protein
MVARRFSACSALLSAVVLTGTLACQGSGPSRSGTGGLGGSSGGRDSGGAGGVTSSGSGGVTSSGSGGAGNRGPGSQCGSAAALKNAQWQKTNWTADSSYFQLVAAADVVLARTWDGLNGGRVFVTTDNGATWTPSSAADTDIDILSIVLLSDNDILAATWGDSYRSASQGKSWDAVARSGIVADTAIRSLTLIDKALFAGTTGTIYKSSDDGNTWTEVKTGLPETSTFFAMAGRGDTLFAGADTSGVFVTKDGGANWAPANAGLTDTHISQLVLFGSRLFAVTLNGVFVSEDSGTSWTADTSALERVNGDLVVDDQLLAGTDASGAYFSSDGGTSWSPIGSGLPDGTRVWSLAAGRAGLYAGPDSGVWRAGCD